MTEEELNALIREIAEDFGGIDPALLRAMVYGWSRTQAMHGTGKTRVQT